MAHEQLVNELKQAVNNRFEDWLGKEDASTDIEVANIIVGISITPDLEVDPAVWSPPGLSSPSCLYQSPLLPSDTEVNKYDVESEWMDSESETELGQSPSHPVEFSSTTESVAQPQPRYVNVTGPASSGISPPLSHVEGQPLCSGQALHVPPVKCIEGHLHCNREQDLCNHPHPQKYARSIAPSVATFEFTDMRSHEPYQHDRTPMPS